MAVERGSDKSNCIIENYNADKEIDAKEEWDVMNVDVTNGFTHTDMPEARKC